MPGPEMNAGLTAGPIQKMCDAGYVPGPDFGQNLTSLVWSYVFPPKKEAIFILRTYLVWFSCLPLSSCKQTTLAGDMAVSVRQSRPSASRPSLVT